MPRIADIYTNAYNTIPYSSIEYKEEQKERARKLNFRDTNTQYVTVVWCLCDAAVQLVDKIIVNCIIYQITKRYLRLLNVFDWRTV